MIDKLNCNVHVHFETYANKVLNIFWNFLRFLLDLKVFWSFNTSKFEAAIV